MHGVIVVLLFFEVFHFCALSNVWFYGDVKYVSSIIFQWLGIRYAVLLIICAHDFR